MRLRCWRAARRDEGWWIQRSVTSERKGSSWSRQWIIIVYWTAGIWVGIEYASIVGKIQCIDRRIGGLMRSILVCGRDPVGIASLNW